MFGIVNGHVPIKTQTLDNQIVEKSGCDFCRQIFCDRRSPVCSCGNSANLSRSHIEIASLRSDISGKTLELDQTSSWNQSYEKNYLKLLNTWSTENGNCQDVTINVVDNQQWKNIVAKLHWKKMQLIEFAVWEDNKFGASNIATERQNLFE